MFQRHRVVRLGDWMCPTDCFGGPIVKRRFTRPAAWLLALLLLAATGATPPSILAQEKDKAGAGAGNDREMADKDKSAKPDGDDDSDRGAAKGNSKRKSDKSGTRGKDDKAPDAKIYLLKSQKKAKLAGAEVMSLVLQDVFTGKTQTMFVPNSDPKGREYDPVAEIATAVEALEEGAPVEVEAAKEKGKWMVSSLARADVQPGEELPTGYVFVGTDEIEDKGGKKAVFVTLKKFGREVKVGVPMWKNKEYKDANWEPDPTIDSALRRLEAGEVVDAKIKPGRPPMLVEIYPFKPPERGKFVALKETTFNGAVAAGFEMLAADGTTVTITLPGAERAHGDKKVLVPDGKMLSAVKRIKPDTEIIVLYREDGQTMFLRDIKFPKPGDKAAEGEPESKEKMKSPSDKPAGHDAGGDANKNDKTDARKAD